MHDRGIASLFDFRRIELDLGSMAAESRGDIDLLIGGFEMQELTAQRFQAAHLDQEAEIGDGDMCDVDADDTMQ
jgi:hypothetical protein